ncbi:MULTISPECIES: branched-chain amino acid ABC transporter permease [unclassified Microbacterium]|uniref:branched-chain amino acid ABC transporter permease n=1 Tax=unclassified Microbacterium TaxID=2609290 RepID=UPI00097F0658|nr:branched-chain amino acid ABC transporter permease [Microbacterium sp. JB110]RCS57265.1 branched-chain amino acid ABC transporter permease [Microbacterium sp. JB110]SJM58807.1 High-affinity branched-chain amino acid transport system permease protein LivH (TC 3.A.1.4.1) [Frigoribacterium sp. JB110]
MIELLQIVLDGLMTGMVYAALALALAVVFQGTGMINLAQGEMAVVAAYVAWAAIMAGIPVWPAMIIAIGGSALLGVVTYQGIVRWIPPKREDSLMTLSVTLLLGIHAAVAMLWGTDPRSFPNPFGSWVVMFGDVRVTSQQIGGVCLVLVTMIAMSLLFTRTSFGLRLRAVAQNGDSAALLGLRPGLWRSAGWAVACAVGAVAGLVAAPTSGLTPGMMLVPLLMALAAANLGGLSSRVGVVIGGLLIGILTALGGRYVPGLGGDLNVVFAFVVVIVVILVKPAGLFGRGSVVRA